MFSLPEDEERNEEFFLPVDDVGLFRRNFYILRHRDERSRFRKSVVRKALTALVNYVRETPGEQVGEDGVDYSVCDTESMWGSEDSWQPSGSDDEDQGSMDGDTEAALTARRGRCYALAPYCDMGSWRGKLIVNPMPLEEYCDQVCLPFHLMSIWIRGIALEDEDPQLDFFTKSDAGVLRPDSFFVHFTKDNTALCLTRAAQRFLLELDGAHGGTIREWGEARAEGECYVDEDDEEARQEVVAWCVSERQRWDNQFKRYLRNPCNATVEGGEKTHGRHGMSKSEMRGQHLNNLEKKLRTKKGKANLVRRTKKQKGKDKERAANACAVEIDSDESESDE